MPTGAYNLNAWSDNLNDAPVIPNGLTLKTWNQALANLTYTNAADQNYNNQIAVLGVNNTKLYFVVANGSSAFSYTSVVTATLDTNATTISNTSSNTSLSNNEITAWPTYAYDYGNLTGLTVSAWNQGATPTEIRLNSCVITNWSANTAGTTFAGGNTTLGVSTTQTANKMKAMCISYSGRNLLIAHNTATSPGTNQIRTWTYNTGGAFTAALNSNNTNDWNIQNGLRMCNFNGPSTAYNNVIYVGYSSTNNLYIGSVLTNGTAAPTQSAYDSGISYTTKNAMIVSIYNVPSSFFMAAILHSDQYIRFVKTTSAGFGSGFTSNYTQSQDFRISDTPNSWYRICATRIDGLGALVYYEPTEGSFYIKFFSINTSMTTLTWGDPIQLNVNNVYDMVMMNADVKFFTTGFSVGIVASNGTGNNQCYMSLLWGSRSWIPNPAYQNNLFKTNVTGPRMQFMDNPLFPFVNGYALYMPLTVAPQNITTINNTVSYFGIGQGDYTYEFWFYNISASITAGNNWTLFSLATNNSVGIINSGGTYYVRYFINGSQYLSSSVVNNNWYHVAVVRESNVISLYLNGVIQTNFANSTDWDSATTWKLRFGNINTVTGGGASLTTEFRLSNIARYSGASFTVPNNFFSNDPNTICLQHFMNGRSKNFTLAPYMNPILENLCIDDWGPHYLE